MGYAYKRARNGRYRYRKSGRSRSRFRRSSKFSRFPKSTKVVRKAGPTWLPHRGYLGRKRGPSDFTKGRFVKGFHTGAAIVGDQLVRAMKRARNHAWERIDQINRDNPLLSGYPEPDEQTYTVTFPDEL